MTPLQPLSHRCCCCFCFCALHLLPAFICCAGNRVTCRDWFQLTLKEGLTVFRDQGFSADMNSAPVKRIEVRSAANCCCGSSVVRVPRVVVRVSVRIHVDMS
jgi:hypothetical protein